MCWCRFQRQVPEDSRVPEGSGGFRAKKWSIYIVKHDIRIHMLYIIILLLGIPPKLIFWELRNDSHHVQWDPQRIGATSFEAFQLLLSAAVPCRPKSKPWSSTVIH